MELTNNVGCLYSFEIYKRKSISEEINTCCLSTQSKSPKCIWPNKKGPIIWSNQMNQNIHLAQQKSSKNLVILDAFKTTHGVSLDYVLPDETKQRRLFIFL